MKKIILIVSFLSLSLGLYSNASAKKYAEELCELESYECIKIESGDTWEKLWPDEEQRDVVRRANRMNIRLQNGMTIAVPKNLPSLSIYDVAPFPRYIDSHGEKVIFVSQTKLAWGAYDEEGELVWWGPISSGKDYCGGVGKSCKTPGGSYRIFRRQGVGCVSTAFPRRRSGRNGGSRMPYCMHYYRGYALHGFAIVPGERASHGCVRLFPEDAKWLNQDFIALPKGDYRGTKLIIEDI
ncbi:MAG: L,D-transpeptidase [Gammaproteobacteria bacterium]